MTGMHEPSSTSVSPTVTGYTFLCCLLLARYHGSSSIGVPTALTGYAILCFLVMAWMPAVAGVPFRLTDVTSTVITAPTLVGSPGTSTLTNMTGAGFPVGRLLVCDAPAEHAMLWPGIAFLMLASVILVLGVVLTSRLAAPVLRRWGQNWTREREIVRQANTMSPLGPRPRRRAWVGLSTVPACEPGFLGDDEVSNAIIGQRRRSIWRNYC